ncbi:CRISPR-associated protein [Roseofilum sp. BLCC_M154]|uniref:CRISPR-associated protein n=1 Tax=Roseofilum acuticapitatum BLCC-M154 TaxID=3022444 RepID=A0ABT7AZN8_9CYAN|nr:hypothetical protein [Roseofilum acuticapitatum]MDJ1172366.1 CRISPR-associated protein [Roseofilum acuticapitatum BLCC-M154]
MSKVIISTVGTSLLTKQIDNKNQEERDWNKILRDYANLTAEQTPEKVKEIIEILKTRAKQTLKNKSIKNIRASSAELNGIYGLYEEQIDKAKQDVHWLIATDTAQGEATAQVVNQFLISQNIPAQVYQPKGLSTLTTQAFTEGIDDLLDHLRSVLEGYDKVIFNLVGSFKSLQGYLNTIGMLYADEIIYIFEGENSELIKIPRLPIKVDEDKLKEYVVPLAFMDTGLGLSPSEVQGIPEAMIGDIDGEKVLSTWGKLIWDASKESFLSKDLLDLKRIQYSDRFREDYNKIKNDRERTKLQEVLVKVSVLLEKSNGSTSLLKQDGGIQYDKYTNKGDIEHFRVTQGLRVSCTTENGVLHLRRYGKEPEVNNNP